MAGTRADVIALSGHVYERTRSRVDGLTDTEYFWEPVPGCWTIPILRLMQPAVDLDGIATWPPAVRGFAERWATALDGTTRVAYDLALPETAQDSFMTLIGDQPVRAYHSTRLLEEEAGAIRAHGLIPLAEELVTSRVQAAYASGHLTAAERNALLSSSVFASGNITGRLGQVCAVAGRTIFDDDPQAVDLLLRLWGGEAIYWTHERTSLAERLLTLGKPSIVVVNLRFAAHSLTPLFAPPLSKLFIGRLLQMPETYGDVHYYARVRPEDVVDIWQPGHHEYDRHHRIPHS